MNLNYKKCGFKKQEGFEKHAEWNVSISNHKYNISLFGKLKGKATENKYDFPPPADNILLLETVY